MSRMNLKTYPLNLFFDLDFNANSIAIDRMWVTSISQQTSKRVDVQIDRDEGKRREECFTNAVVRLMECCTSVLPRHPNHFSYNLMLHRQGHERPDSFSVSSTVSGAASIGEKKGLSITHVFDGHSIGSSHFQPVNLQDPRNLNNVGGARYLVANTEDAIAQFAEARRALSDLMIFLDHLNDHGQLGLSKEQAFIIARHLQACVTMLESYLLSRGLLDDTNEQTSKLSGFAGQLDVIGKAIDWGNRLAKLFEVLGGGG